MRGGLLEAVEAALDCIPAPPPHAVITCPSFGMEAEGRRGRNAAGERTPEIT